MSPSLCICLLLFHLQAGGALGKTKPTGGDGARGTEKEDGRRAQGMEEFMEDIRRAMSSQWELLQNIRYHTLVTKVRVAQLETQVKKLASQVEGTSEAPQLVQHTGSEEPPPSALQPVPTTAAAAEGGSPCPGEADAGVMLLVEAMRNLTSAYNRLINSTQVDPGQATTIAQDFSILTSMVQKMRNLTGTPSASDELITTTTTTVATTTASGEEDGSVPKILAGFSPNVTIDAGGTATLTCRFLNLGNKAVNWVRGREILTVGQLTYTSDERFQSVHDAGSGDYKLQIKSVMSGDEGPYDCQALTEPNIYHRIWLTVQDVQSEGGPSILTNYSTNVTAAAGDTATLNCRVSDLGDATVFWYRDRDLSVMSVGTSTYTTDTRVEAVNEEDSGDWQLKIREVQKSDEGWYDCVLVSPTHVSHKVWLSVLVPTPSPDADLGVESKSTVFTVREGETATLACRVSELGDATVSWARRNGLELLTAEQYGLSPDPRFTAVHQGDDWLLHIKQVQKEDAGPYECHVSTLPPTLYTFWLQVEGSATSQLKVATMDVRTVEGRDVDLICRVSGHAKPIITWVKDSFPLTSDRHQVTQDGNLVISSVTRSDEGRYVCIATSPQGSAEGAALLTVKEATRIVKGPRDKVRNTGETVVFRCKAAGDSDLELNVEWLVNGELVNVENELRLERRPNNSLVVKWLLEQDSGVYTCLASTKLDAASASATLTVQGSGPESSLTNRPAPSPTSAAAAAAAEFCTPPYEAARSGLCILQVTDLKYSWLNALEYCRASGGELASEPGIASLKVFLKERYSPGGDSWLQWPFWVGGREEGGGGGGWRWMADGSRVDPDVWASGHPRRYGSQRAPEGSCMILDGYHGYDASALPCHLRRRFLCRLQ